MGSKIISFIKLYSPLLWRRAVGGEVFLFLFLSFSSFSQKYNDVAMSLHEEAINKVFTAIGEIKGSNDYEVMFIKGKYHWKIINPKINLKPDSSDFTCDAQVEVEIGRAHV